MIELERLSLENFYKNMDERNELINEGLGLAGHTPTGLAPNFSDLTYKPEELSDFFYRVRERYESDFAFIPEMLRMEYGLDSEDFIAVSYYLTQLGAFVNAFPALLEHESLSQLLGDEELSQNIMECMLFYVLIAMKNIEDISSKRS